MADLECDMCDEENATFILTNLSDGAVAKIGANCWPLWVMAVAQGIVDAEEDEITPAGEAEAEPDPKPNGRSRKTESVAATAETSEVTDDKANDDTASAVS